MPGVMYSLMAIVGMWQPPVSGLAWVMQVMPWGAAVSTPSSKVISTSVLPAW